MITNGHESCGWPVSSTFHWASAGVSARVGSAFQNLSPTGPTIMANATLERHSASACVPPQPRLRRRCGPKGLANQSCRRPERSKMLLGLWPHGTAPTGRCTAQYYASRVSQSVPFAGFYGYYAMFSVVSPISLACIRICPGFRTQLNSPILQWSR